MEYELITDGKKWAIQSSDKFIFNDTEYVKNKLFVDTSNCNCQYVNRLWINKGNDLMGAIDSRLGCKCTCWMEKEKAEKMLDSLSKVAS